MHVTAQEISHAIRALGISQSPVCIHSSLSSFGRVEGGAETVIQGFLGLGCTVMVPTFSSMYAASAPPDMRPLRNGCGDYSWLPERDPQIYTPQSNDVDMEMGVIPKTILAWKNRFRGNHPINSFTAVGPLAERLIASQDPQDVYAPLRALATLNGYCILMGVGLERLTIIHMAEQMAGRKLFRRWAKDSNGNIAMVEAGGCSEGFGKLEDGVSSIKTEVTVGKSVWKVFKAVQLLQTVNEAIAKEPMITHCGWGDCDRCNDAVLGGPILD
jgi:aminoglycoside N3'-acetyltransferase